MPSDGQHLSTLAEMQAFQQGKLHLDNAVGVGSGVLGKLMQWVAEHFEWLESRLLLQQGGGKWGAALRQAGEYLDEIEALLMQPRYLILLIAMTLAVIL